MEARVSSLIAITAAAVSVLAPSASAQGTLARTVIVFGEIEKADFSAYDTELSGQGFGWTVGLGRLMTKAIVLEVQAGHGHHARNGQTLWIHREGGSIQSFPGAAREEGSYTNVTVRIARHRLVACSARDVGGRRHHALRRRTNQRDRLCASARRCPASGYCVERGAAVYRICH